MKTEEKDRLKNIKEYGTKLAHLDIEYLIAPMFIRAGQNG